MAQIAVIAGIGLMAGSSIMEGEEKDKQGKSEAKQLRRRANVRLATSQRDAISERRLAEFQMSRALAVSAASGAGTTNVTVANLIGDLDAEGEYRALARLYVGEEEALGDFTAANDAESFGSTAKSVGYLNAGGTILTGIYG